MEFGRNSNRRFAVKNKEIKQIIFSRKKNKKWIIVALVLVLTLGGGSVAAVVILHRNGNQSEFSMPGNMAGLTFTEDMTAASGVTNVGITEASFDVENMTTELEIEEVYAVSGEEVTAGDKILKLTEDSVEEARKELERALEDAELAYRTGAIEYEQNLITAEYTRDSAILTGQQAKEVYDETVASLQSAVARAEEELQDAEDDIAEYESYVNDGSYKSYFKADEYQAIYDENLKALTDKLDEWGIGWSQITGGSAGSVQAGGTAGNVLGKLLEAAAAQQLGILTHGERVQIGHEIIAVKDLGAFAPVFDRAQIRPERQVAGGLNAREHDFLCSFFFHS